MIAINVASTAAILSMMGFCVFSAYCVFVYRRLGQKECTYCDAVLKKDEKMVEHLKTCEEYKTSHVKRSEVYKSMKKAWA
jgi:thioredoxin-related protein